MEQQSELSARMSAVALTRWAKMTRDQRSSAMMRVAAGRMAKLTPERRSEIAKHAAIERWKWVRACEMRKRQQAQAAGG